MKILKYILEDINSQEKNFLIDKLNLKETNTKNENVQKDIINSINDLLKYAPEPFLKNIEQTLKDFKSLSDKFE